MYNKILCLEYEISRKDEILAKQELLNRERTEDEKTQFVESKIWPPVGKFFEIGIGLRDKTEKEKVEVGEILLATIKEQIETKIKKICYEKIISGFESNALGEIHVYDSDSYDQDNLVGAVASGESTKYKCTRKADNKRAFYLHNSAQIRQVLIDGKKRKEHFTQKSTDLIIKLEALTNYDAIMKLDISKGWE